MRLDHRGQQVVGRPDRVDVAREMEVDQVLRHDLRAAPAGAAALDPEDGAERRLAQAENRPLAQSPEGIDERDRGGRLAFAGLGGRHRRDAHELPVGLITEPVECRQLDLRGPPTVRLKFFRQKPEPRGDLGDGSERDLDLRHDLHVSSVAARRPPAIGTNAEFHAEKPQQACVPARM